MGIFQGLDDKERTLMALAIVGLLLTGIFLANDRWLGAPQEQTGGPVIGRIRGFQNDTRVKSTGSFAWNRAQSKQQVLRAGDSVFTGKGSSASLDLDSGASIELGANSLVLFADHAGTKVPDLSNGNFRIRGNGTMKVRLAGEVVEIQSDGASDLQVVVDEKGQASVRALSGSAKVHGKRTIQVGTQLTQIAVENPKVENFVFTGEPARISIPLRLSDTYDADAEGNLRPRTLPLPARENYPVPLIWKGPAPKLFIQHARDAAFTSDPITHELPPGSYSSFTIPSPHIGSNFWRISRDRVRWEPTQAFEVVRTTIPETPMLAPLPAVIYLSENGPAETLLSQASPIGGLETIYEVSTDPEFKHPTTRVLRAPEGKLMLSIIKPGPYFVRARFANADGRVSSHSSASLLEVRAPKPIPVPMPSLARSAPPRSPARIDTESPPEAPKETYVPPPEPTAVVTEKFSAPREHRNENFSSSRLQLEGAFFTMYSKNQVDAGRNAPVGTLMNIRFFHWWSSLGVEAQLKTKVLSANDSARETSPTSFDARLHLGFATGAPFNLVRDLKWTFFTGFETYKNPSATLYSPKYDLIKAGFSLAFPMGSTWDSGGEAAYGLGFDKSRKYELSGFLGYYLRKTWSLGVGYRMHYFEAGSTASAPPLGLPFREAYGEGFSVLRWHY